MEPGDVVACATDVQLASFPPELQESDVPYWHRLRGCPGGCFVAEMAAPEEAAAAASGGAGAGVAPGRGGWRVIGYGQSHPWAGDAPPSVTVPEDALEPIPSPADAARRPGAHWFVFDVSTTVKRAGVGEALAKAVLDAGAAAGFTEVRLVAVRGAHTYWARFGFETLRVIPAGAGYGSESAVYMRRALAPGGGAA
jgi:hypothetical protein